MLIKIIWQITSLNGILNVIKEKLIFQLFESINRFKVLIYKILSVRKFIILLIFYTFDFKMGNK